MYAYNINGKHTQVWYTFPDERTAYGRPYAHSRVGAYRPNAWGIYDCHGNVLEWCLDWYGEYPNEDVFEPVGATSGTCRVFRGGCHTSAGYFGESSSCRSASRFKTDQLGQLINDNNRFKITASGWAGEVGFRIVAHAVTIE